MGIFSKKDRRIFTRVDKQFLLDYSKKRGSNIKKSLTKNISGNGVLIETPESIPMNTILYITLNLPKYGEVIVEAQVSRVTKIGSKYEIGLAFFNIDAENKNLIMKALQDKTN